MDEATLIGEVISLYFIFFRQIFTVRTAYTHFRLLILGKTSSFEIFNPFYLYPLYLFYYYILGLH